MEVRFTINGREVRLQVEPTHTALHVIREVLGLKGTKEGCSVGE
jgi:aerobic-type carbon monoxide dehydrogenase small subunit (CoxS/CutS family)